MKLAPRFLLILAGPLLALLLHFEPAVQAADVDFFVLAKGQSYMQTNAGPADLLDDTNRIYHLIVLLNVASNGAVSQVSVSNNLGGVTLEGEEGGFFLEEFFPSKDDLDQSIPPGAYTFTIVGENDGTNTVTLLLGPDAYPNTPHISNWADLQDVNPFEPARVRWDAMVNGGVNDFIRLQIKSSGGNGKGKGVGGGGEEEEDVFATPDLFEPGALNGLSNSIVIPAGVLQPNHVYEAQLLFVNVTTLNTNVYPGAKAGLGFFKESEFYIATEVIPPQGRIEFAAADVLVSELEPGAEIQLVRVGGAEGEVSVHFATTALNATAGADYSTTSLQISFPPGITSRKAVVPIIDDVLLDPNERVRLGLSNPQGGVLLLHNTNAVLTIEDNETAAAGIVSFSAAAYPVSETNSQVAVVVRRSGGASDEISVSVEIVGGTATRGQDYDIEGKYLGFAFAPGQTSRTNVIAITDDESSEGNEEIELRITDIYGGARLGVITNATVVILDDEITIQFASATYTNLESVPVANILVERTGPPGLPASVQYRAGAVAELGGGGPVIGAATEGVDYVGTNGILEFPAGVTRKPFQVRILNDSLAESAEAIPLHLSGPGGNAQLGVRRDALLVIRDTDAGGIIQFAFTNVNVLERADSAMVMVTRSSGLAENVRVMIQTANRTASQGSDYNGFSSNLVFRAQEVKKTIRVPILEDSVVEGQETFRVRLSEPEGGATLGEKTTMSVTITDNDVGGIISFGRVEYSTNESGVAAKVLVTRTAGAASDVTVRFTTSEGATNAATPDLDYTNVNTVITFEAGAVSQVVMVPIFNDFLAEGTETVSLWLREPTGGARLGISNAVLRIVDDESSLALSSAAYAVSESSPLVNITVVRSGANSTTARVEFATSDLGVPGRGAVAGIDYISTNFTLTFPPGVNTRVVPIRIRPDTLDETNELFEVLLLNPTGTQLGSISSAFVTINDDDQAGALQFSASSYSVVEGTALAPIKILRTGGTASGVTVRFETGTGTATAGTDYTAVGTNLTFGVGETMKTVAIPIAADNTNEVAETISLILTMAGGNAVLGPTNLATLTINNRPDANVVPLDGPEFFRVVATRATNIVFSRTFNAAIVTAVPQGIGNIFVIQGSTGGAGGLESCLLSAPITGTGSIPFDHSGPAGIVFARAAPPPADSFGFVSNDEGDGGTLIIDGFDGNRISGRVNAILSSDANDSQYIRVVITFRASVD